VEDATRQALITPPRVVLDTNAPNPFQAATRIRFGLPRAETVSLEIYSALGQRVAAPLDHEPRDPGYHTVVWDGRTSSGAAAPSGVYLMRLTAGATALTRRVVRIR
jgi:flagellar hook assembly protein FlgD